MSEQTEIDWKTAYYEPLLGAKVTDVIIFGDDTELWPQYKVQLANGRTIVVEVLADAEGNQPGFLFGLPAPVDLDEDEDFYSRYYGQLVGAKITEVGVKFEDDETFGQEFWPVIDATLNDGQSVQIEVSRDEEGNGPGFLAGLSSHD